MSPQDVSREFSREEARRIVESESGGCMDPGQVWVPPWDDLLRTLEDKLEYSGRELRDFLGY